MSFFMAPWWPGARNTSRRSGASLFNFSISTCTSPQLYLQNKLKTHTNHFILLTCYYNAPNINLIKKKRFHQPHYGSKFQVFESTRKTCSYNSAQNTRSYSSKLTKISGALSRTQITKILTSKGPGISSLQTSCSGTPNFTFSNLLGYGKELGCPQDVTTLLNVAARRCILLAQLLILPVYGTSGQG